jgi:hypothetical protein
MKTIRVTPADWQRRKLDNRTNKIEEETKSTVRQACGVKREAPRD